MNSKHHDLASLIHLSSFRFISKIYKTTTFSQQISLHRSYKYLYKYLQIKYLILSVRLFILKFLMHFQLLLRAQQILHGISSALKCKRMLSKFSDHFPQERQRNRQTKQLLISQVAPMQTLGQGGVRGYKIKRS